MFTHRARFAVPLVVFAALAVPQLGAAEVRDRAGIFSSKAVEKAEAELDRIERRTHIPVVIETIEAIPGLGRDSSASEKRTAVERFAVERARELGYEGVYLLISKNDHVFSPVLVQKRYNSLVPLEKRQEVRDTLTREFKAGRFRRGLTQNDGPPGQCARGGAGGQRTPASGSGYAGSQARRGAGWRNSGWELSSRSAWESSESCCSYESWAGSSAGPEEGIPRRWAWAACLSPEWGRAPVTDQDMVADMVLPAAVSSRACSEDLAELLLATGFTTSSRVATAASDTAMPRRIQPPNPPHPQTRAATNSLAVMTMAAREPPGTIQAAPILVVVTGAAAMAVATGAGAGGGGDWGGGGGGDGGGW